MFPEIVEVLELVAINPGTLPLPLVPKPIAELLFVQVYVAPTGVLLKVVAETAVKSHTFWLDGTTTVGLGFTAIEYALALPTQPE